MLAGPDLTYNGGGDAFVAKVAAAIYPVGGRVTDWMGQGIEGLEISCSSGDNVRTDARGYFTVTVLMAGSYVLTPTALAGWLFVPPTCTASVPPDALGEDFFMRGVGWLHLSMTLKGWTGN